MVVRSEEKEILVSDLDHAIDYYTTIFGIKGDNSRFIDEKVGLNLCLKQASNIKEIEPQKLSPEVYSYVPTVAELYSLYLNYRENGALFAFYPRDTYEDGLRGKEFAIRDLDGYIIAFKTIIEEQKHSLAF